MNRVVRNTLLVTTANAVAGFIVGKPWTEVAGDLGVVLVASFIACLILDPAMAPK